MLDARDLVSAGLLGPVAPVTTQCAVLSSWNRKLHGDPLLAQMTQAAAAYPQIHQRRGV